MAKFNLGYFLRDKDLNNMLSRVDGVVDSLDKQRAVRSDVKDDSSIAMNEFVKMTKDDDEGTGTGTIYQLLQNITVPAQRSNRYRIYDEIYSSVQIIKSIVRVYITNILQKDIITGNSIVYVEAPENKTDREQIKKYKQFLQDVVRVFDVEKILNGHLVHDLVRYGDHYIEVIDLQNDVVELPGTKELTAMATSPTFGSQVGALGGDVKMMTDSSNRHRGELEYLSENLELHHRKLKNNGSSEFVKEQHIEDACDFLADSLFEFDDISLHETDVHINCRKLEEDNNLDLLYEQSDSNGVNVEDIDKNKMRRVLLRFHNPKQIVILTTAHNNSVIGYVEIKDHKKIEVTPGVGMQFASIIKQISAISKSKVEDHSAVVRRIVNRVIGKLVKKLDIHKVDIHGKSKKEVNKEYEDAIHQKLGDDLFFMIKRLYIESDPEKNEQLTKVSIRFIAADRIVPISLNPVEYAPYGTSIIDPLIYPGKLYLLTQLTNIVMKLSRAALIRKWTIETGPREQHTNLMNKLKRELRNQRIKVDDITSFKSIPKILSD